MKYSGQVTAGKWHAEVITVAGQLVDRYPAPERVESLLLVLLLLLLLMMQC